MKEYVAVFMKDSAGYVALVRKNKPTWQAGKLNGIGGAVEPGEHPRLAMWREWIEETGHAQPEWNHFATLRFDSATVHFFKASVDTLPIFPAFNDIGERIEKHPYELAVRYVDTIPNLKWLLPLAFEDPNAVPMVSANDNGKIKLGVAA